MTFTARWLSPIALLAAAAVLAGCTSTAVRPTESIGPNDPAAIAGIRAAFSKSNDQKSFRARMTSESGGKVTESTIEFSAPSSVHMVMKTENMEQIVVGGAHYMKSDGRWIRLPIATGALIDQLRKDPATIAALERTISGATIVGHDVFGGRPATVYRYYQAASIGGILASSAGWAKLWVSADGLPVKVESDAVGRVLGISTQSKTTILYSDYGAPVRIVAPL